MIIRVNDNGTIKSANIAEGTVTSVATGTGLTGGPITGSGTISLDSTINTKIANTNVYYGTCSTAATTAAKTVTLSDSTGFELRAGAVIGVKFSYTNTASEVTINVNNTGAKSIYYKDDVFAGSNANIVGCANYVIYYMYDGEHWVFLNQSGNYYTAFPSVMCETSGSSVNKIGTITNYTLTPNTYLHVNMRFDNTVAGQINFAPGGATLKPIYINGAISSSSNYTLPAGTYIAFYNGTYWDFRTDGKLPGVGIVGDAATVNGHGVESTVANDAKLPTGAAVQSYVQQEFGARMIHFDLNGGDSKTLTHSDIVLVFSDRGGLWTEGVNSRNLTAIATSASITLTRASATTITVANTGSYSTRVCAMSSGSLSVS